MLYRKEREELKTLIQTGYPLIYIVTADERPVIHVLKDIIKELKDERHYTLRTWDRYEHLYDEKNGNRIVIQSETDEKPEIAFDDPISLMENIRIKKAHTITVLHDFHNSYDMKRDKDRGVLRALKSISYDVSMPFTSEYSLMRYEHKTEEYYKHMIITSPFLEIPKEIEKIAYVVEFGLPGKVEVQDILDSLARETELSIKSSEEEEIINAMLGLTETEVFYAIKKSILKNDGELVAQDILKEKKQILKKTKLIEHVDANVTTKNLGGMTELVNWIRKRKLIFSDSFRKQHKLDIPKGILLTGVQGCGKSFAIKAIANDLGLPLLRLDMGMLMGSLLGDSERNLRKAIELAEAVAPCVLWIDEIEKSMPNDVANGHETTRRMFGKILTWLQEKESLVFVAATANNINQLPTELLRKGRFDEIFFVDLPSESERKEIFTIHLNQKRILSDELDLDLLAKVSSGYSGAEIEVAVNEAVLEAAMNNEKLQSDHITREMGKTNPISITMKDQVEEIREWAVKQNVRRVSDVKMTEIRTIGFH